MSAGDDRDRRLATLSPDNGPVGAITPQPWMIAPETRAVFAALETAGGEARFVGGCVRDALLRRPVKDIDIATHLPPERAMAALEAAGIHAIPTGLAHGTVTAVVDRTHFEITTLRRDLETDGRRARVAFTDDWTTDAARRDFTINALFCTLDGTVFDPFGGMEDLADGRVRFVGNARQRCEEDLLRVLRFFRFHAHYGRPPIDRDALAACRALAPRLPELSGERVRNELFTILLAPDPATAVLLMRDERVLAPILPEAGAVGRLRLLSWLESTALRMDGIAPDAPRRLAALIDTDSAGAEMVADRLRVSNRQRARLVALAAPSDGLSPDLARRDLRRLLHHQGSDLTVDRLLLAWAAAMAEQPRAGPDANGLWLALLEEALAWTPVVFPLRGRDALGLGVAHGPRVGDLLRAVRLWWEEADFQPDRSACLDKLRQLAAEEARGG